MKIPLPEEAKQAMEQAQKDMAAVRELLQETNNLLRAVLDELRASRLQ